MDIISHKIDILLFGHDHHHIDFRDTDVCNNKYGIPTILSAGSTTKPSRRFKTDENGNVEKDKSDTKKMRSWVIEINDDGSADNVSSLEFN